MGDQKEPGEMAQSLRLPVSETRPSRRAAPSHVHSGGEGAGLGGCRLDTGGGSWPAGVAGCSPLPHCRQNQDVPRRGG